MTYDFHGAWEGTTGHNSPLYRGSHDSGDMTAFNTVRTFNCRRASDLVAGKYGSNLAVTVIKFLHLPYIFFPFQDFAMKYWRDNGAPPHKLRMGFATYGRTFRLSSSNTAVGALASGAASAGPYTREAGFWSYYEVKFSYTHTVKKIRTRAQWHLFHLVFTGLHLPEGSNHPVA